MEYSKYDIRDSRISVEDRRCSSILYYCTEPSVLIDTNIVSLMVGSR